MKIAVVSERIEAWRGGAETSTLELARLLAARGHDVHIVTASRCPSPPDLVIHSLSSRAMLRPLQVSAFVRRATRFLNRQPWDVIHAITPLPSAHTYQPRGGLVRETIERNIAIRPTASRRLVKRAMMAMNVKQQAMLELERRALRAGGPMILAVSRYVARQCEEHYGLKSPRVRVVFNGVNCPLATADQRQADRRAIREQYHIRDETLLLLFIAHNLRLKGFGPLVQAAKRLVCSGFEDFQVLVVGRDNPVRFKGEIRAADLEQRITFTGATQRVSAFYHAADVLVHPTYYDPCSRVVLEALARGLPCVTTSFNGASEVMTDGREGYIIDSPDEIDVWTDRILGMRRPELRERMSAAALELRQKVSMSAHVEGLLRLFEEIARDRRGTVGNARGSKVHG